MAPKHRVGRIGSLLVVAATLASTGPWAARAEELPVMRKGMWEHTRSIQAPGQPPQTITGRTCTTPTEEWKKQDAMLRKLGCTFSPVTRADGAYRFAADCPVPGGGRARSSSAITPSGDSAYTIRVETEGLAGGSGGKTKTVEELTARRVGECAP